MIHPKIIDTALGQIQLSTPPIGSKPFHMSPDSVRTRALPTTIHCTGGDDNATKLHVIVPINNYVMYSRRYELFWRFKELIEQIPLVELYVVEVAFGDRAFMCTESNNPKHLQLRTSDELWHKENSINLMVQRLPPDWQYVAWIDGDLEFVNKKMAEEAIQKLQHYKIVQLFQNVCNFGPNGEVISTYTSFCSQYVNGKEWSKQAGYEFWHPGFAWACTRTAWNEMGGLIDYAILGAADHHMALCLINKGRESVPGKVHPNYMSKVMQFQTRCLRHIKLNIGYVTGTILHYWHGKFKDRKYIERWDILTENNFDPEVDIKRDWQGLYILEPDSYMLRDGIRRYFRQRNEDSIDNN
jgi:hypothetical protein